MRGGVWHAVVDHLDGYLLGRSLASLSIRCFFINPSPPSHQAGQRRACADYARIMRGLCAEGSGTLLLIILTDTFLVDPLLLCRSVASSSIRRLLPIRLDKEGPARIMRGLCAEGIWHAVYHLVRYLLDRSVASLSIRCFFIDLLFLGPFASLSIRCFFVDPLLLHRSVDYARTMSACVFTMCGVASLSIRCFFIDPLIMRGLCAPAFLLCAGVASLSSRCFFIDPLIMRGLCAPGFLLCAGLCAESFR